MPIRPEDLHRRQDDERGEGEQRPQNPEREGEFDGRTFVLIRDTGSDDGSGPLPPSVPFWISPDIVVTPPGGSPGGPAQAGEVNDLRVSVTNRGGVTAYNAQLDVFLADPSTAFTPATADLLASTYVTLPGYNVTDVSLPWSPTAGQAGAPRLSRRLEALARGSLCGLAQFGRAPVGVELTANVQAPAEDLRFDLLLGTRPFDRRLGQGERLGDGREIVIAPDEAVHCSLAFSAPQEARAGDVHLVEVVQNDSDGRAVGGLWVALVA